MSPVSIPLQLIRVGETAASWQEAVEKGGELLVRANLIKPIYVNKMLENLHTYGPYIIMAPGVAFPHARPEHGVIETGISVVTFREPVSFGPNPEQQVEVMICLAAVDSTSHLDLLQMIADLVGNPSRLEALKRAETKEDVLRCFSNGEEELS